MAGRTGRIYPVSGGKHSVPAGSGLLSRREEQAGLILKCGGWEAA